MYMMSEERSDCVTIYIIDTYGSGNGTPSSPAVKSKPKNIRTTI